MTTQEESTIQYQDTRTIQGRKYGSIASLGEFEGRGKTKSDAKHNLLQSIATYVLPDTPLVLQFRNTTGIVYRVGFGWGYQIIPHDRADNTQRGTCLCGAQEDTRRDIEKALRLHLAQWHMNIATGDTAEEILLPEQVADHRAYFQQVKAL